MNEKDKEVASELLEKPGECVILRVKYRSFSRKMDDQRLLTDKVRRRIISEN